MGYVFSKMTSFLSFNVAFSGFDSLFNHIYCSCCVCICWGSIHGWDLLLYSLKHRLALSSDAAWPEDAAARWWPCMQYLAHSRLRALRPNPRVRAAPSGQSATTENEQWTLPYKYSSSNIRSWFLTTRSVKTYKTLTSHPANTIQLMHLINPFPSFFYSVK